MRLCSERALSENIKMIGETPRPHLAEIAWWSSAMTMVSLLLVSLQGRLGSHFALFFLTHKPQLHCKFCFNLLVLACRDTKAKWWLWSKWDLLNIMRMLACWFQIWFKAIFFYVLFWYIRSHLHHCILHVYQCIQQRQRHKRWAIKAESIMIIVFLRLAKATQVVIDSLPLCSSNPVLTRVLLGSSEVLPHIFLYSLLPLQSSCRKTSSESRGDLRRWNFLCHTTQSRVNKQAKASSALKDKLPEDTNGFISLLLFLASSPLKRAS